MNKMNFTPVRIAILLIVGALILLSQTGCATRGYVDRQCFKTGVESRAYSREKSWSCLDYISAVEDKVDLMAKKSEVGRVASAQTRASLSLTDVLERQKSEDDEVDEANAELFRIIKRWRTNQQMREIVK